MRTAILYLCIALALACTKEEEAERCQGDQKLKTAMVETVQKPLTAMDALDLVKEIYAANFIKIENDHEDSYYYKLSFADYYLVYEGQGETEDDYLIHLYEFVEDDAETGIGHFVTYGWYTVNRNSGEITEQS